jgi:hypothetical protein
LICHFYTLLSRFSHSNSLYATWAALVAAIQSGAHFNILAAGFLGGRAEAHPYKRRRAYSV